jgi:hypothetical protein
LPHGIDVKVLCRFDIALYGTPNQETCLLHNFWYYTGQLQYTKPPPALAALSPSSSVLKEVNQCRRVKENSKRDVLAILYPVIVEEWQGETTWLRIS